MPDSRHETLRTPKPALTADYARLMVLDDQIALAREHIKLLGEMGLAATERYNTAVG